MRLEKTRALMAERGVEALLISTDANMRWLTGFTGGEGVCLVTPERALLLTDFRYTEQANAQAIGFEVVETVPREGVTLAQVAKSLGLREVHFEAEQVTVKLLAIWQAALGEEIALQPSEGLIAELRMVKDPEEIAALRKAAALTDEGFTYILGEIRPGVTEASIALKLEFYLRERGASKVGFDFIVASGERSSLPHGMASERVLQTGDFVTLDFGVYVDGYTSDITRTVVIGAASPEQRRIYELVRKAQEEGFRAVKPGRTGVEVDGVARSIIAEAGHGEHFGHGLGHGVGLMVHERPRLNTTDRTVLQPGMLVTVEPGVYVPGFGGVRIEDMVLVTESGGERLTSSRRDLIEIR